MKPNISRYRAIALAIGVATLTVALGNAPEKKPQHLELLSYSFGVAPGQTLRINVASTQGTSPLKAVIQLLDTEGEPIAQSDEMTVLPGRILFWDVSRDMIPASGEPGTGRLQVRTRILVDALRSTDLDRNRTPLGPSMEFIDPGTGKSAATITVEWVFVA